MRGLFSGKIANLTLENMFEQGPTLQENVNHLINVGLRHSENDLLTW